MFRAIILPIFRSARLCVTVCGIMHTLCCRPLTSWMHYTTSCNTQSSAPKDGQNNCPKHVELVGIINKPLLLQLVGCLYYLYQWCTVKQISNFEVSVSAGSFIIYCQETVTERDEFRQNTLCNDRRVKLGNFRNKFLSRFVGPNISQSQNFVFNFALTVLMRVLTW